MSKNPAIIRPFLAPNGKPTLGFLLASLHTGASRALWPGLIDAAERLDANLICFPGGRIHSMEAFENQRNVLYDLVGEDCVDGIVTWSSALGGVLGPGEVNTFHQRYQGLPLVSLAQIMEGTPTVSIDSYHGMRTLLTHLIETHGLRKLAFIRGPEGHYYAQERYRAYLDTLQTYNIPLDPQLVTRPLRWEAGAEAVQILLDERGLKPGLDFQAIVAVSDMLALWAMKTLQARGFQIPDDLVVAGFNNSIEERFATPPLTTVDLPFYAQGARAVEVLLALLKGEQVPGLLTLPSHLVIRQSCGCPSSAVAQAADVPAAGSSQKSAPLETQRQALLTELASAAEIPIEQIPQWIEPVVDTFLAELSPSPKIEKGIGEKAGKFVPTLEHVLDQVMRARGEIPLWQNVLSSLRRRVLRALPAAEQARAEALLGQARVVVSEALQRSHAYWQWQAERQTETIREVSRILLTTFDLPQLTDVLAEYLPRLGIPSAYLALYENPSESLEFARLMLAYTEKGRATLEAGGRRFLTGQLVPPDLLPARRYSLVVEPLYFQERSLGFLVCELGPHEGDVYELVRSNLSSALQGARLFDEIQQARLTAEKADRIKTRLLANVSHEMRTPLNIIIGYTQNALRSPGPYPPAMLADLHHIQSNAEHQLRVINDLLDLSRAEIDELDLALELLDPRPLLVEAFQSLANQPTPPEITWKLDLPERLPLVRADAVRLRQILLNLLSNARKFTERGQITLGAQVVPPHVRFWVADTGLGIPPEQQERIFEPFVTIESDRRGIGLGLSITRHLVALHNGTMRLESQPGQGSTFQIELPLPALDHARLSAPETVSPVLLLISTSGQPTPEIAALCQRQGLEIRHLRNLDDLESALANTQPVALAWDLSSAQPGDWGLVRRLRHYPALSQTPFILYGDETQTVGLTGFLVKSPNNQTLLDAINALCPAQSTAPVLIVDDDPHIRAAHRTLVENSLPGCPIQTAENGEKALEMMAAEVPALVLLDMVMPGLSGADVLDQMRADPRLRQVPVIVLSNKMLTLEDVRRLEAHTRVTFQNKGVWSQAETSAALQRALSGEESLPAHTSALVKRAVAYLHQNYSRQLARWEIAEAIGVSEDYLTRVFNRELGLSPWDYLNRYRVLQAQNLLKTTSHSIGAIARLVGFSDAAYFSRVFSKQTGISPQGYRERR